MCIYLFGMTCAQVLTRNLAVSLIKAKLVWEILDQKQDNVFIAFWQSPTPAPYVKETSDAAQFYMNRVLKDFKEK